MSWRLKACLHGKTTIDDFYKFEPNWQHESATFGSGSCWRWPATGDSVERRTNRRGNQMDADLKNSRTSLPAGPRQTQRQYDIESARNAKRLASASEREAMFACLHEIVLDGL